MKERKCEEKDLSSGSTAGIKIRTAVCVRACASVRVGPSVRMRPFIRECVLKEKLMWKSVNAFFVRSGLRETLEEAIIRYWHAIWG